MSEEKFFKSFFKEYEKYLREVREETFREAIPIEWIDFFGIDWIKFAKEIFKERPVEAIHSLSGVILLNLFKLGNWVFYEISSGKYLEAIRNLRFIFEGSVYSVIYKDAIEDKCYKTFGGLSKLTLKQEILELLEEAKKERVYNYRTGKVNKKRVRGIVDNFFKQKPLRSLDEDEKNKYKELYSQILCDKRLYFSIPQMIDECRNFIRLSKREIEDLKGLWHRLSQYQHFSSKYLNAVIEEPATSVFIEKYNEDLFRKSRHLSQLVLSFFIKVLKWRFPKLFKKVNK